MADMHEDMIRRARAQVDALGSSSSPSRGTASPPLPEIPNYEILREIQRGGQGAVYLCRQTSTRREVALKVLHARDSGRPADRVRFQREVEILAALRHPNVVTIHDSGSIGDRFYYAMEYIAGRPLDRFLAEEAPPIRERVRLFAEISAGVGAAHLRGVIHRDLKPGNIRVDEHARCHVLDFGLARFADDSEAQTAPGAMTQTGQFLGSLPWASPEQVAGQRDELDLRTDVYSLGVLLYQALTGRFPYRVTGALSEVVEQIRTAEPAAPSRVARGLNDELDTIVRKCLAKDRERRYSTAVELASDLRRYLNGEPIEAKRDSVTYLLKRQLRKHWLAASVGAAVALTVAGSLIATLSFWRQAVSDRALALQAQATAESESEQAKAVLRFLNEEILAAADPENNPGSELTVCQALEAASERLPNQFADSPLVGAAIRAAIGQAFRSLGMYDRADAHLSEALAMLEQQVGPDHPDTIDVVSRLATLRAAQGRHADEVALQRRVLAARERAVGREHADTLAALNELGVGLSHVGDYDGAEAAMREALAGQTAQLGSEARATLASRANLASMLLELGRTDDAGPLYHGLIEAFERCFGREHPHTLSAMSNYAFYLSAAGEAQLAESTYRRVVELQDRVLGPTHPATLLSLGNLALVLGADRLPEAEALQRQVLAGMRSNPGPDHPNTLLTQAYLASTLADQEKFAEAEELCRDAVNRGRPQGPDHPQRAAPLAILANILVVQGRYADAEPVQRELLDVYQATLAESDELAIEALGVLATIYRETGRPELAEPLLREELDKLARFLGPDHDRTRLHQNNLASFLRGMGRPAEAAELLRELLATLPEGDVSQSAAIWRGGLGACLLDLGQFSQAEHELRFALQTFERDPERNAAFLAAVRERIAALDERRGKPEPAGDSDPVP